MTADLLDGKRVASEIRAEVADKVRQFVHEGGPQPCLTAVLVGEDPASQVYVRNKSRACEKAGIDGRTLRLDAGISQQELLETIQGLNDDPGVHGILVQLPLPTGGNGGKGGDLKIIADSSVFDLYKFKKTKPFKSEDGMPGGKNNKSGRNGKTLALKVPTGTIIRDENEKIIKELNFQINFIIKEKV